MAVLTIPHTFQDGVNETASGVQVNENFAAVKAAVDPNTVVAEAVNAGNAPSKYQGVVQRLEARSVLSLPELGSGGAGTYTEPGINFPEACAFAIIGGFICYADVGRTALSAGFVQLLAGVSGKSPTVTYYNPNGFYVFPRVLIVAWGR